MKKIKIYISDEGFGPIVRQRAIVEHLLKTNPELNITIQLSHHIEFAKKSIPGVSFIERFNNIIWKKTTNGYPDNAAIKNFFSDYIERSDLFIKEELNEFDYDLIISDFVYEAFEIARRMNKIAIGVSHFTWDWFFSKLYPPPVKTEVIERFLSFAGMADKFYFPPFTPIEIENYFHGKINKVPLIVSNNISHKKLKETNRKYKIIIMDSGAGVLHNLIKKALPQLNKLQDFQFYVSSQFDTISENISIIDKKELFIDYINDADLVIGRAGFNTISECIAMRTPMLLLSEGINPEMSENIISIKNSGLGSFISLGQFTKNLDTYLPAFMNTEYEHLKNNMLLHKFETNGAEIIANEILNYLK